MVFVYDSFTLFIQATISTLVCILGFLVMKYRSPIASRFDKFNTKYVKKSRFYVPFKSYYLSDQLRKDLEKRLLPIGFGLSVFSVMIFVGFIGIGFGSYAMTIISLLSTVFYLGAVLVYTLGLMYKFYRKK